MRFDPSCQRCRGAGSHIEHCDDGDGYVDEVERQCSCFNKYIKSRRTLTDAEVLRLGMRPINTATFYEDVTCADMDCEVDHRPERLKA